MTTALQSVMRSRVRDGREVILISDEALAREVGIDRWAVWGYRTGRREMRAARALAIWRGLKRLGVKVTLEELLGRRAA